MLKQRLAGYALATGHGFNIEQVDTASRRSSIERVLRAINRNSIRKAKGDEATNRTEERD